MRNGKLVDGHARSNRYAQGFTYIGLLIVIAIAGIGLAATGITWHNKLRSEKEKELLFVGDQYRQAIASYYQSAPADTNSYPAKLEDMLLDKRYSTIKRHLRKLYADPMTESTEWGLIKQQGRIVGIYSLSNKRPMKVAGFDANDGSFKGANSYRKWVFGQDALIANTPPASPAADTALPP